VKPSVVPDESDRWITVIELLGRFIPGFRALIAESFHFVIFPMKISASVGPSSFRPLLIPVRL